MVITFVAQFDPGCRNQIWCEIIRAFTPHKAYNVVYQTCYLSGGQDADGADEANVARIAKETDIIVACPGIDNGHRSKAIGGQFDGIAAVYDGPYLPLAGKTWADLGKPVIVWLWGSMNIRGHFREFHEAFDKYPTFASDEDIATDGGFEPGMRPSYMPWAKRIQPNGSPFIVSHSASDLQYKNTPELLASCESLGITPQVIRETPYRECIQIKSGSHANFDHMQGYSGASSWECTELGVPNIVDLKPQYRSALKRAWECETIPPWLLCDSEDSLRRTLSCLMQDGQMVIDNGKANAEWFAANFKPAQFVDKYFVRPAGAA
jgi:hypothetical protein